MKVKNLQIIIFFMQSAIGTGGLVQKAHVILKEEFA